MCLTLYLKFNIGSSCAKIRNDEFMVSICIYIRKCHTPTECIYWCMWVIKCIKPPLRVQTPGTVRHKYINKQFYWRLSWLRLRSHILPHYPVALFCCNSETYSKLNKTDVQNYASIRIIYYFLRHIYLP